MSQQNKSTLQSAINTQIADNNTGEISAADVRDNLINITDSLLFNNGDPQTLDGSLIVTGAITGSLYGNATYSAGSNYALTAQQAFYADYVPLTAGPGITLTEGGLTISSNVLTVNGINPDGDGNIPLSLGTVLTGTSASLVVSSSGAVTASIADATVWIVSGDGTPANNGDAYIFKSGSVGQWLTIAPLDQAAGDARYARKNLTAVQPLTSSFAVTASSALTASYISSSNIDGNVPVADFIPVRLASEDQWFKIAFTDELYSNDPAGLFKESDNTSLQYNPSLQRLIIGNISASNFTGSLSGTASYALTASHVIGGGGGAGFPYTGDASITGSLGVQGNITSAGTMTASDGLINTPIAMFAANDVSEYPLLFTSTIPSETDYLFYPAQTDAFTFSPNSARLTLNGDLNLGFLNTIAGTATKVVVQGFGNAAGSTAYFSHAEGTSTSVIGQFAHAEGSVTKAVGNGSHAEGYLTIASGSSSHAEGSSTIASGSFSHAEGQATRTTGSYSHAEGVNTRTVGDWSHAEGSNAVASGSYSHAEGFGTRAQGIGSHAEGFITTASGQYSHAEGQQTFASSNYSHAEGLGTIANSQYQLSVGKYNFANGLEGAFTVGNGTSDAARSSLLTAASNNVDINGVLTLYGSVASGLGTIVLPQLLAASYINDATAAAAGIPVGGLYRNGSTIQIRLV